MKTWKVAGNVELGLRRRMIERRGEFGREKKGWKREIGRERGVKEDGDEAEEINEESDGDGKGDSDREGGEKGGRVVGGRRKITRGSKEYNWVSSGRVSGGRVSSGSGIRRVGYPAVGYPAVVL